MRPKSRAIKTIDKDFTKEENETPSVLKTPVSNKNNFNRTSNIKINNNKSS